MGEAMSGLSFAKLQALGFSNIAKGVFVKASATEVAFVKTGNNTLSIKAGTSVSVAGRMRSFAAQTDVIVPALTSGTDYAIYVCADGTLRADASFTAPSGYTTENSRKIGGFHYAPGGCATGRAGGDTTPQINEYSLWDIKFCPACSDPRGMALVANAFWSDIYLTGVDHYTNGTSKYNVAIADGASPPKVPAFFGGNGATAYTSLTWWEAAEVAVSNGKRLPTYAEFAALAFGCTEASSVGTDPISTIWQASYVSKFGVNQATGVMWQWGDEFGGGAASAAYVANTGGRGSTYQMENAVLFGGNWSYGAYSGSRASYWNASATSSSSGFGLRCVCDPCVLA